LCESSITSAFHVLSTESSPYAHLQYYLDY
jgi:hypothetical protein